MSGYTLLNGGTAIRCNACGRVSHSARDVANKYCGNCHRYHNDSVRPTHYRATGYDDSRRELIEQPTPNVWNLRGDDDARPSSSEVCRPDTSIDYGNSSRDSDWGSSCDTSSSTDTGSCSCD